MTMVPGRDLEGSAIGVVVVGLGRVCGGHGGATVKVQQVQKEAEL